MKLNRPFLALTALAMASLGHAQATPRVEMGFLVDQTTGLIDRFDLQTGRYFGAIGTGKLSSPHCVAVDDKTGIVYVGDSVGIKKFDVSTGRYLGTMSTAPYTYVDSIGIAPNGSIYALGTNPYYPDSYRLLYLKPDINVWLGGSPSTYDDGGGQPILTLTANGGIEVWDNRGDVGHVRQFAPDMTEQSSITLPRVVWTALQARSGDTFYSNGYNLYAGSGPGAETPAKSMPYWIGALAEGSNGVAYAASLQNVNGKTCQIDAYDSTTGTPYFLGSMTVPFPGTALGGMAVYVRY